MALERKRSGSGRLAGTSCSNRSLTCWQNAWEAHDKSTRVKGYYCNSGFYNYPYTFGLLFGLGLYARCQASQDEFRADYDDFQSSTGMYDAHTLASRFGIDTHSVEFWRSSLDVIRGQIGEYERLIK
jgi:oligoendopeptidase F